MRVQMSNQTFKIKLTDSDFENGSTQLKRRDKLES
jgi:type IV secretory pathway TrbF-like protein